jgi:hypothetical protein
MRLCPIVERGSDVAPFSRDEVAFGEANPRELKRGIHGFNTGDAVDGDASYKTLPVEMDVRGEAIDGVLLPQERVDVLNQGVGLVPVGGANLERLGETVAQIRAFLFAGSADGAWQVERL